MKTFLSTRSGGVAALVLLVVGGVAVAQTRSLPVQGDHGGKAKGDETYQIQQRKRWFIEQRGLDRVRDTSVLRENALRQLRVQRPRLVASAAAAGEVWTPVGPSSMKMGQWAMGRVAGRLTSIAPHPTDDNTVYVGAAAGGLWKTSNAGASWAPVLDSIGNYSVGSIHVEANAPQNVWVGTGDRIGDCAGYLSHGVHLSTNSGTTWVARNGSGTGALGLKLVNSLLVLPANSNVVLAGGGSGCGGVSGGTSGLYRSTNRGVSWTRVLTPTIEDMVVARGTSTVYAAAPGHGVYKSIDGGATWTNPTTAMSGSRLRLAISNSDRNTLYAFNGTTVYRSRDAGLTWTATSNSACSGQCWYNLALAVHPTSAATVIAASIRPARSTNWGTTFSIMTNSWGGSQQVHQDTHVVVYSKNNPNRIWIGSDGGIWRTDDGGASWANMNSNLSITQFYDIAVHPNNADIVFGGAQDNSSSARLDGTDVWDLTYASGDGFMNLVDEVNPNIVFQTSYPQGDYPNILRSTQGGAPGTFSGVSNSGLVPGNFAWKTILATAGGYAFVGSNYVHRMNSAGSGWTSLTGNLGTITVITPRKIGGAVPTYVGTSSGAVHYSANGAGTTAFSNVTGNLPGGRIGDIAMDPTNAQRVFVVRSVFGGAKLYRSTTAGTTWTAAGAGLPDVPVNAIRIDPLNTQRIFVGTDVGVYVSENGGSNFVAFSTGMPVGILITDLEIDNAPHVLVAGTYGRGAWKVPLGGNGSNQPPVANYTASSTGLTATFRDASTDSDGTIVRRNWNFGDGTSSPATDPRHIYAADGTYVVRLTVVDNEGAAATRSYTVTITGGGDSSVLTNGVPRYNLPIPTNEERRFTLVVPSGASGLKFTTTGINGDADLYVKFGSQPSTTVYDCKSDGATSNEACSITTAQPGTYHVLVRAYAAVTGLRLTGSYVAASRTQTYTNANDVAIADNATVESTITVTGRSGKAPATATLALGIEHSYRGDLKVDLVAPDGTLYPIHDRTGGSVDNVTGSYTLNLSGRPLNGKWKLRVRDNTGNDTGRIDSWSLAF